MRILNVPRSTLMVAAALALLIVTPASSAETADRAWQLRVSGLTIDSGMETEWVAGDGTARFRSEAGGGVAFAIEYSFSPNVGIELGAILGETDLDATGIDWPNGRVVSESADFGFRAHTLALNLHVNPDQPVEFFIAPTVAQIDFFSLRYDWVDSTTGRHSLELEAGSETAWGATVGIDVPVRSSPWSVSATIRYLRSNFNPDGPSRPSVSEANFEPLMFGAGFRYEF